MYNTLCGKVDPLLYQVLCVLTIWMSPLEVLNCTIAMLIGSRVATRATAHACLFVEFLFSFVAFFIELFVI